jgi:DNA-cytosine methyltransferase
MTGLTYGSLFSGVGGMDMGFDTHMDCVFQVEWDKHAQSILRRHWPDVPKWGDVQEVNGADLPPCDVLTFGSPCQDLSVAGKRAGLDGGRSSMFYEAVRIIKEMRDATSSRPTVPLPRAVLWENVPGALSSNLGADFKSVIDEMVDLGACLVEWAVLDAQHFGVPQRRRRVFLVAIFDPATADRCPNPLLPVSEGRRGDFAKGRKKGQDVAGSVATSVDAGSTHRQLGHGHYVEDDTASALKQRDYKDATDLAVIPFVKARRAQNDTDDETWVEGDVTPTLNAFDNGGESRATVLMPIIFDGTRHDDFRMETEIVPTLKQRMGTGGGQVPMLAEPVAASFKPGASAKAYGIGYEEEMAPTLESGGGGNNKPAIIQPVTVFQPGAMIRLGGGVSNDIVPTLRAEAKRGDNEPHIAQPIVYDGFNQLVDESGVHRTLRVGRDSSDFVAQPYSFDTQFDSNANVFTDLWPTLKASQQSPSVTTSLAVRRLTPLECERLMGWPDHHTRWTDEGKEQADTHRYKQCGNGVAAPVARWIAGHLTRILG